VLVIDGLALAAFPDFVRRMLRDIAAMDRPTLRSAGLATTIAGLVLLLLARLFLFD
jgi:uncharacterized protein YjeT (DUF2065 family)